MVSLCITGVVVLLTDHFNSKIINLKKFHNAKNQSPGRQTFSKSMTFGKTATAFFFLNVLQLYLVDTFSTGNQNIKRIIQKSY